MKKFLRSALCMVVIASMLTGCGAKKVEINPGIASAKLFDDMKKGEVVDGKTVTNEFNLALDKIFDAESISIKTQVGIELTEDEKSTKTRNATEIKYMPVDGNTSETDTEETTAQEAGVQPDGESSQSDEDKTPERVAYINVANSYDDGENKDENNIEGYFEDGILYYNIDDKLIKEPMTYDDLIYMIGSYNLYFEENVVDEAVKIQEKDKTRYIIHFDHASMTEMMLANLASTGSSLGENESMSIESAYLYFEVDSEGYMSGFDLEIDAKFTSLYDSGVEETEETTEAVTGEDSTSENASESKESPYKYSVVANFADINSTKVEKPDNFSDSNYMDVQEYLEQIQQESEAQGEDESTQMETAVIPEEEPVQTGN